MFDLTLRLGKVHYWQGAAVALVLPVLLMASMQSVRVPTLAVICRTAGRASYPLYVLHQLCGYWILNFAVQYLHTRSDLRLVVVLGMVALSLIYGNWLEPKLVRLYKNVLVDATDIIAGLLSLKPVRKKGVMPDIADPARIAGLAPMPTGGEQPVSWRTS